MPFKILNKELDYTYFANEFKDNMHFNYISNDDIGPSILSIAVAPINWQGKYRQIIYQSYFGFMIVDGIQLNLLI